jgi:Zn-dependent protease with chaperone function
MDFFQAQDSAHRNTTRLVIFFTLAVLSLIVITNLLVMVLFGFVETGEEGATLNSLATQFDWQVFFVVSAGVLIVIVGGSAYKTMTLSGGGVAVAESLGGRLISHSTSDLHERKALNVVEEMAIAAGTPVPPVYLLEQEQGINAFAAGFTPGDAVIGLTRGTITYLTREELQGVIAHELDRKSVV